MKRIIRTTAITCLAVGLLPVASAQTLTVTVDCSRGQTIAGALRQGDARKPLVVIVRGTCNENVSIARNDVTLRGQPGTGATINGPDASVDTIVILKDLVNIEDLEVTGGFNGIRLQGPSSAGVRRVTVRGTASNGMMVRAGDLAIEASTAEGAGGNGLVLARGGSARIFGNSQFRGNHLAGIFVQGNSTLGFNGGTVSDNEGNGVTVESGSQGTLNNVEVYGNATGVLVSTSQATLAGGNNVHHNREHGVLAQAGAILGVNGSRVTHNGRLGVFGYLGATVVMGGNQVTDNGGTGVSCLNDCTLQMSGDRVTRNGETGVSVQRRSTLIALPPTTDASGNAWVDLWCGDRESSVELGGNFIGSVDPACTGFDD